MDVLSKLKKSSSNTGIINNFPQNSLKSMNGAKVLPSELFVENFLRDRGRNTNKQQFTSNGSNESMDSQKSLKGLNGIVHKGSNHMKKIKRD